MSVSAKSINLGIRPSVHGNNNVWVRCDAFKHILLPLWLSMMDVDNVSSAPTSTPTLMQPQFLQHTICLKNFHQNYPNSNNTNLNPVENWACNPNPICSPSCIRISANPIRRPESPGQVKARRAAIRPRPHGHDTMRGVDTTP